MIQIPRIIHQIWSDTHEPLPNVLKQFGNTWKSKNPSWKYILWDNQEIEDFMLEHYPQYIETYNNFHLDIQRCDAIRYLILDKMGGVYADFDTECLKPLDELLENKKCCFSFEPVEYQNYYQEVPFYFNNAFMASIPNHPFINDAINRVFYYDPKWKNAKNVFNTTGPLMLVHLYQGYKNKEDIYLIPPELASPITREEGVERINNNTSNEIESKIQDAYLIHYFFSAWVNRI